MLGKFSYHSFWNFYDNLGRLALLGIVCALAITGTSALCVYLIMSLPAVPALVSYTVPWVVIYLLTVLSVSAVFHFCYIAIRDESARLRDALSGVKLCAKTVSIIVAVWSLVFAALVTNFFFYFAHHNEAQTEARKLTFAVLSMFIGWFIFLWSSFLVPWLCTATTSERVKFRLSFRMAITYFVMAPRLWLPIASLALLIGISVPSFPPLIVLVLPLTGSLGHTAYRMTIRYIAFLEQAREALGHNRTTREYKAKARELEDAWESAQPRRTFRELLKPWEH